MRWIFSLHYYHPPRSFDKYKDDLGADCWFRNERGESATATEQFHVFVIVAPRQYDRGTELGDMVLFSQTIGDNDELSCKVVLGGISYDVPRSEELPEAIKAKFDLSPGEYELHLMSGEVVDLTKAIRLAETARNNYYGIAAAACRTFNALMEANLHHLITRFMGMMERFAPNTCKDVDLARRMADLTPELERGLRDFKRQDIVRGKVIDLWREIYRDVRAEMGLGQIVINIVPKSNEPTSEKSAVVDGGVAEERC